MTSLERFVANTLGERNCGRLRYVVYLCDVFVEMLARGERHVCNVCGFEGRFRPIGHPPRYGAECPRCLSVERHRLLKLWIDQNGELFSGKRLLHFAPEPALRAIIRPLVTQYQAADIDPEGSDLVLDIEQIDLPDGSQDIILCSHVLEHVDDRKALAEFRRVLSEDGVAIIMVPLVEGWDRSYENPGVVSPKDRASHFGQSNHLRYYGRDVRDRIRDAGFHLEEFTAVEPDVNRHGLLRGEKVFVAHVR